MNKTLRIFISSPGDVGEERLLTHHIIKRLQAEFANKIALESIFWEQEPLLATADFQTQVPAASKADIAVFVLWSRLGTPLSAEQCSRPDGSRYNSGTEYEFEDAIKAFRQHGSPSILVYRKTADPVTPLKTKEEVLARLAQKDALDAFIERWFIDSEGSFTAAFHPYATTAQFEDYLEQHLRKLIQQQVANETNDVSEPAQTVWNGSPFRGLQVFEFDHAPIFFGRTRAVGDILNALRNQAAERRPFVLLTGMSGIGKSSVVRAGVLPSLTQPGIIEGVGLWRHAVMRPAESAGDLFDGLANALLREQALPELSSALSPKELAATLRQSPSSAVPLIKLALSQAAKQLQEQQQLTALPITRLVLVVDQLEELFTLQSVAPDERRHFVAALAALINDGQIWIIATLRSDFYHRCAELPALQDMKEGNGTYDLKPPSAAEILQMIRQPARIAGLRFEEDADTGARLDDTLYNAVIDSANALPLLEFTLQELFNLSGQNAMLSFAAYRSLGGVEGSLAKRAETVFDSLPKPMREQLPAVLSAVVEFGHIDKKTPLRRYVPLASFAQNPPATALIDAFVQARLFVTDRADDGAAVVSVAHEALLQHWPRIREWIEQNLALLFQRTTLSERAQHWQDANNDPDLLLEKGKPLDDAEALLEQTASTLTDTEKSFVRTSTAIRRSQGKYAWLGGLICWTVMLGISTAGTLKFTESSSLWNIIAANGVVIAFALALAAPVAWTTLMRWLAMPLTKELRVGKLFWTICTALYGLFFYLAFYTYNAPGTELKNYLGYVLILAAMLYVSGEKWLRGNRRRRQLLAMNSAANHTAGFRIPLRELAFLLLFLLIGAFYLITETGSNGNLRFENYRDMVHDSSGPRGIGPLVGERDIPYLYYQFKLDPAGRVLRVEQIGLPYICVQADSTNYQNLAQTLGFDARACVFDYVYNADGTLRGETAYNKSGQQIWTLQFTLPGQAYLLLSDMRSVFLKFKKNSAGYDDEIAQLHVDTALQGAAANQIVSLHRLSHNADGWVTQIRTTDLSGQPQPANGLQHTSTTFSHNPLGLLTEISYFAADGQPIQNEKGYASETDAYDAKGNLTGFSFFDSQRRPIKSTDGYASLSIGYNSAGKMTEIKMLNESGQPATLANGISRWTLDYDANGNLLSQSIWDSHGNPTHSVVTVTGICCEAEKLGLRVGDVITHYDGQEVVNHFTLEQQMARVGFRKRTLTVKRDGKELVFRVSPGVIGMYFWSTESIREE
ncbi:AAA family ATPase [Methylomonas methanica]|uniref:Novel STAND NTPase 1 domain-containing protein n=1 Tax=Methylomonas methanica (strain DSM 25384 / MC09) TaxID=857087 RepID=G0A607_METMM|nr:AAA family ATPase [Methylomonas methanica]AEG00457.1 hypothetical protein Metme_2051 [Methylomonas methanica MC09]